MKCIYLNQIKYTDAIKVQKTIVQSHLNRNPKVKPSLLLLQHYPVYTVGLRSSMYSKQEEDYLTKLGADYVRANRGGLITFHGPGQLVVYPILNLKEEKLGVKQYVNYLEEVIIQLCNEIDISAKRSPHTGVWIGNNKVCAMGINVQRGITSHGLALNCNIDLSWFNHIVPCGIHGKGVTSISECLNRNVTIHDVIPLFLQSFEKVFNIKTDQMEYVASDTEAIDAKIKNIVADHSNDILCNANMT